MIHSMAGGDLGKEEYLDLAKVEILEGKHAGEIMWFATIDGASEGKSILVKLFDELELVKAKILRIDARVSSFASPVSFKRVKRISKII